MGRVKSVDSRRRKRRAAPRARPPRARERAKQPAPPASPAAARPAQPPLPAPQPESEPSAAETGAPAPGVAGFPVVGMVASAGGLDAFKKFFQAVPANSGAAFVLIPHLDPRHESLIAQLLARYTQMPVREAEEGIHLEPNSVYVIPPGKYLLIHEGALRLSGPVTGNQSALDLFLRSLAEDQQDRAICVVLSGTGAHGALGMRAIKGNGGMAMVQDPRSAEYDSMPRASIATGLADFVLSPELMPEALVNYLAHVFGGAPGEVEAAPGPSEMGQLLALLRARTKFDFRSYRKGMLLRRVRRRIGLSHTGSMGEYLTLLRDRPEEVKLLAKDLLISVTSFFRDPEAFRFLEAQVIPEILHAKTDDSPLRVWVPGCATGEEAYSIAMLFIEQLAAAKMLCGVQVFATDIDRDALEVARRGVYGESEMADVSPERVARFFTRTDEHSLQVSKQLREAVMFAPQNVLSDAPFSKLDLVSCRNLLIYLEPDVQQKIVLLLHFALNDSGYLLLGPSETVGRHIDLFDPVSKKWRVYRRLGAARPEHLEFPITPGGEARVSLRAVPLGPGVGQPSLGELGAQALVDHYAPAAALVNRRLEVLHFYGPTELYLQQPSGPPTQDVTSLAREGLRARIRAAVQKCWRETTPVRASGARVKRNGRYATVHVTAQALRAPHGAQVALVTFEEEALPRGRRTEVKQVAQESMTRQLEHELKSTREELQSTIEELESANEELKASNEEVMSMNEELQSANEELETSKEELQSLNEELSTVNSQLQEKVEQLEGANNDMANLLNSAEIATLFLGADRTIRRFTPAAGNLYRVIPSDVGRPIGDVVMRFEDPDLGADIDAVLHQLAAREKEVLADNGRWYLRRITPYRTLDDHIEGVVLAFHDVTLLKLGQEELRKLSGELEQRVAQRTAELATEVKERARAEDSLREEHGFMDAILGTTGALIIVLDTEGRIVRFNKACEGASGLSAGDVLGTKKWEELIPPEEREGVSQAFDALRSGHYPGRYENHWRRLDGSLRLIAWSNTCVLDGAGAVQYLVGTGIDITEGRHAEHELLRRQSNVARLHRLQTMGALTALLAHEMNQPLAAIASYAEASLGQAGRGDDGEKLKRNLEHIVQQAQRASRTIQELDQFLAKGEPEKVVTDLGPLLHQACGLVERLAEARGVRLDCSPAMSLPKVFAQPMQIEHVVVNLLQNALDAVAGTGKSGGAVTLGVQREGKERVRIGIEDSGPGVDAAAVEQVFEPLYTTKTDGLGLGLSICRSIVEAHGGKIWALPGPGGKFYFTLPVSP